MSGASNFHINSQCHVSSLFYDLLPTWRSLNVMRQVSIPTSSLHEGHSMSCFRFIFWLLVPAWRSLNVMRRVSFLTIVSRMKVTQCHVSGFFSYCHCPHEGHSMSFIRQVSFLTTTPCMKAAHRDVSWGFFPQLCRCPHEGHWLSCVSFFSDCSSAHEARLHHPAPRARRHGGRCGDQLHPQPLPLLRTGQWRSLESVCCFNSVAYAWSFASSVYMRLFSMCFCLLWPVWKRWM